MRFLSVALLFVASTAAAQNWQQVASLDSNGGVLLVDASDITEVKGYRRGWFKWAYATDQPVPNEYRQSVPKAKTYRWVQSAYLFHCTEQTSALAEQRWFNSEGKDLGSRRPEALRFLKVSPGSVDQRMLEAVCRTESLKSLDRPEEQAQMTHAALPGAYYPKGSIRRGEQGSATVKACVDPTGKLLREPVVTISSGFPELDGAAIQVAKDSRYRPGVRDGAALPESCLEVPVTFRQQKNIPKFAAEAKIVKPVSPDHYYPSEARGRGEQGSAVVQSCVGRDGKLVRDPVIAESSGFPALDAAAIEVAKAAKYAAGSIGGVRSPESCIKFKVKFARDPA
jgi:TonB family protein